MPDSDCRYLAAETRRPLGVEPSLFGVLYAVLNGSPIGTRIPTKRIRISHANQLHHGAKNRYRLVGTSTFVVEIPPDSAR